MEKKQRSSDVKVGIFVAVGVMATFLSLFVIGQERKLWEKSATLKARFSNVAGLKVGGQVRLAGVNIGIVSKIQLPELDPRADAAVMPAFDLSTVATNEGSALVSAVLPLKNKTFAEPINVAVIAADSDEKLEATVEVLGTDLHGQKARERLMVRLRGVDNATVGAVYFASIDSVTLKVLKDQNPGSTLQLGDGTARKLTVEMRVTADVLERIRTDSIVTTANEGLLGDRFIDISLGSLSKPQAGDGDLLLSAEGVDIAAALAQTGEIIDNVNASTESIRALLEGFRKAGGEATIVAAMRSIQDIADEIQHGSGLIHQLVFDRSTGQQYKEIVGNVQSSTKSVNESLVKVDAMLADLRTNQSLAHELLYGTQGAATIDDARRLIAEATQVVTDVRTKEGLVHNLIYEQDRGEILASVNAAAADVKVITGDVKQMVAEVKKGKGTVGQLLKDPTVYEDLKLLLGNVRRNDAVKTLVRYAIEQEDKKAQAAPQPRR
ncbi:MAG: MCE family protein [Deltaproteobacteria bacterium]|nr:MCE family protein [Deltaproteobacteria bacterium]